MQYSKLIQQLKHDWTLSSRKKFRKSITFFNFEYLLIKIPLYYVIWHNNTLKILVVIELHWIRTFSHWHLAHGVIVYYKRELLKESMAPQSSDLWLSSPAHTCQIHYVFPQTHMILSYSKVQTTQTRVHKPLPALIHVLLSFQICLLKCKSCHSLNSSYYDFFLLMHINMPCGSSFLLQTFFIENFLPLAGVNFQFFWLLRSIFM